MGVGDNEACARCPLVGIIGGMFGKIESLLKKFNSGVPAPKRARGFTGGWDHNHQV